MNRPLYLWRLMPQWRQEHLSYPEHVRHRQRRQQERMIMAARAAVMESPGVNEMPGRRVEDQRKDASLPSPTSPDMEPKAQEPGG